MQSLLKGAVLVSMLAMGFQSQASYVNLTGMSRKGLDAYQSFMKRVRTDDRIVEVNHTVSSQDRLAYTTRSENYTQVTTHFLHVEDKGAVKMGEFQMSRSTIAPYNIDTYTSEAGYGIIRYYSTNAGRYQREEVFETVAIGNRPVRVHKSERIESAGNGFMSTINLKENGLDIRLTKEWKHDNKVSLITGDFRLNSPGGPIIGFHMSGNGNTLKVYTLNEGKVTETIYELAGNMPESFGRAFEARTSRVISGNEIADLGFFAVKMKSIPGRSSSAGTARAVEIEPSAPIGQ